MTDAQMNMPANQPTVNYSRAEGEEQQTNISIERSEPVVHYESAEPNVDITSAGKPQIKWGQTGEPQVTYPQAAGARAQRPRRETEKRPRWRRPKARPGTR